jgi:hypothetical protein
MEGIVDAVLAEEECYVVVAQVVGIMVAIVLLKEVVVVCPQGGVVRTIP